MSAAAAAEIWELLVFQRRQERRAPSTSGSTAALREAAEGGDAHFATILAGHRRAGRQHQLLHDPREDDRGLEIGWTWLTPAVWGTGANTEAKFLQLQYAFETLGCIRVDWDTYEQQRPFPRGARASSAPSFEGVWRNLLDSRVQTAASVSSAFYSVIDDEWLVRPREPVRTGRQMHTVPDQPNVAMRPTGEGDAQEVVLSFPYDGHLVNAVRSLPGRKFDWDRKEWSAPADGWVAAKLAEILKFRPELTRTAEFDEWLATAEQYWVGHVRTTRYDGRGWFALDTLAGTPPAGLREGGLEVGGGGWRH